MWISIICESDAYLRHLNFKFIQQLTHCRSWGCELHLNFMSTIAGYQNIKIQNELPKECEACVEIMMFFKAHLKYCFGFF